MRRLLFALLLSATVLAGCDRAELDDLEAGPLTTSPDLGVVRLSPDLRLEIRPSRVGGVAGLRIGQRDVPFDSVGGAFVFNAVLEDGLNAFVVEITDDAGETDRDTLYALYLDARQVPIGSASTLRADAAVSPAPGGSPLVTGRGRRRRPGPVHGLALERGRLGLPGGSTCCSRGRATRRH